MNSENQHRITYKAGITRTPSDFLCQDGELAECINLTTDSEELKPVVQPVATGVNMPGRLLYLHRIGNVDRYIYLSGTNILCTLGGEYTPQTLIEDVSGEVAVESVGNTLIISTSDGLTYFLWDYENSNYKILGNGIPDIQANFSVTEAGYDDDDFTEKYISLTGMVEGTLPYGGGGVLDPTGNKWVDGNYNDAKTALSGLILERLRILKEKRKFAFPFWARTAVRLSDGSYANISNPFLLIPTVKNNWNIFVCNDEGFPKEMKESTGGWYQATYKPMSSELKYQMVIPSGVNLSDWSDIITGVEIFVSEETMSFDVNGDWKILNVNSEAAQTGTTVLADTCMPQYKIGEVPDINAQPEQCVIPKYVFGDYGTYRTYYQPSLLTEAEIVNRITEKSRFYRLLEIEVADIDTYEHVATDKIDRYTLLNLTTQNRLDKDDYFSRNPIMAGIMKTYNGRLHLADITRGFFGGFTNFSYTSYAGGQTVNKTFCVYIRSESGTRIVKASVQNMEIIDIFFYYPDPRAYKVEVYDSSGLLLTLPLKEHPGLNGAYYLKRLPGTGENPPSYMVADIPDPQDDSESLTDHLMVSEVNNPFLFTNTGDINVGMGGIVGLASQTMDIGEMEHGLHPMTVFSERGISMIHIKDDGTYERVDHISREVCLYRRSITETDGPVFFVSKKGLMVLEGRKVTCVSDRMDGKAFDCATLPGLVGGISAQDSPAAPWAAVIIAGQDGGRSFLDYLLSADCMIAYDYMARRLLIINPSLDSHDHRVYGYAFAYNIADGTVSKVILPSDVTNVVNNYPDYLMQAGESLYSLYGKPRDEDVSSRQLAFLLTRPMKLAGPVSKSSLRQLKNVGMWDEGTSQSPLSCVKTKIYLSDDLRTWYDDVSRFGSAAKYYRLALFIRMLPTERLSGTIITDQQRRTNNLR